MSSHRTRIKICGIKRVEDAVYAANAGADAIGMIFYAASPRALTLDDALHIRDALPPFVATVALFVNAEEKNVHGICEKLQPTVLQFHGEESPEFCARFGRPYIKSFAVNAGTTRADLLQSQREFRVNKTGIARAKAMLLDTDVGGQSGGTGKAFDWAVIPAEMRAEVVLAGGLNPQNIGLAVASIRPWAVDVSSGVEKVDANGIAQKGVKDHHKIKAFIEAVRLADQGI
jgi:phosphoribosylanthranilate isomerase